MEVRKINSVSPDCGAEEGRSYYLLLAQRRNCCLSFWKADKKKGGRYSLLM